MEITRFLYLGLNKDIFQTFHGNMFIVGFFSSRSKRERPMLLLHIAVFSVVQTLSSIISAFFVPFENPFFFYFKMKQNKIEELKPFE